MANDEKKLPEVSNDYVDSLGSLMQSGKIENVKKLLKKHENRQDSETFVQFMDSIIEKSGLSRTDIAQRAGMSRDYTYKILSGQKQTSERDYLIAVCIALRMNLWQTQRALSLYPFPVLDDSDERSAIIKAGIKKAMSMDDINMCLESCDYPLIRISPDMPGAKIRPSRTKQDENSVVEYHSESEQDARFRKGVDSMKNENESYQVLDIKIENIPWMMIVYAEAKIIDSDGQTRYVSVSYTGDGDFFEVHSKSLDDDDIDADCIIEQYDSLRDAISSGYIKLFCELDRRLDETLGNT